MRDRNAQYEKWYGPNAATVKASIQKVRRAGRDGDPDKIMDERLRHFALMLTIIKKDYSK